jgi:hypothetical protein
VRDACVIGGLNLVLPPLSFWSHWRLQKPIVRGQFRCSSQSLTSTWTGHFTNFGPLLMTSV